MKWQVLNCRLMTTSDSAIHASRERQFYYQGATTKKSLVACLPCTLERWWVQPNSLEDQREKFRNSVEGEQQWGYVGELGKVKNKSCSCIMYQFQRSNCVQRHICEEQVEVVQSSSILKSMQHFTGSQCNVDNIELSVSSKETAAFQTNQSQLCNY